MKKKNLQSLKEMEKNQLIDKLLLETIKGGCCGGPQEETNTTVTTYRGAGMDSRRDHEDAIE